MGQKVNPHGFRVGVIKDWDSRWYASNEKVGDLLVEDHKIRVYLKKLLFAAGVSKIEIEMCIRDSPHGGGEGKAPVGRPGPVTPWGKPALGYKTRKKKNRTDKFIVRRRNAR